MFVPNPLLIEAIAKSMGDNWYFNGKLLGITVV